MARRALIVANGKFSDLSISPLKSPVPDAKRLKALLCRPEVGGYEVTLCLDERMARVLLTVQQFFDNAHPDDLHFVLITGHGIKDRSGKLHFATADTQVKALSATSVEARFINERMEESRADQQLLFVDTCYSGAFQRGTVNKSTSPTVTLDDFADEGVTGRAIITASTAIQVAGERESGGAIQSIFTKHLIEGIESGAADPEGTGKIRLGQLFEHIRTRMRSEAPGQQPQPYWLGLDPKVVVALNPVAAKAAGGGGDAGAGEPGLGSGPPIAQPGPRLGTKKPSRWAGFGRAIDNFFCDNSPMNVAGLALLIGGLVILLSSLLGIAMVQISTPSAGSALSTCGVGKSVGLWTAPNWWMVYLVLFPTYLFMISALASHVGKIRGDTIVDEIGRMAVKANVDAMRSREMGAAGLFFVVLGAAVCALALTGWWTSAGGAIYDFRIQSEVVDWSTAVVVCGWRSSQWWSFAYTLVAYLWVGLALYGYFACLVLGGLYALFLQRLAAGDLPGARLMFRHKVTTDYLRHFFLIYFSACVSGFLAAYCMRLQADYVGTANLTFLSYWLGDLPGFGGMLPSCEQVPQQQGCIQPRSVTNQTLITAGFMAIVTLLALLATTGLLQRTFRVSKEYLLTKRSGRRGGAHRASRGHTPQEMEEIEKTEFLASVVPHHPIYAAIVLTLILAIAVPLRALLVPLLLLAVGAAWLAHALICRRVPDRAGAQ